jgi:hypothetical protein
MPAVMVLASRPPPTAGLLVAPGVGLGLVLIKHDERAVWSVDAAVGKRPGSGAG